MANKTNKKENATGTPATQDEATRACRNCTHWQEMKERIRIGELLEKAVKKFETKLKGNSFKPTLAEYLKLLQLEKEIETKEFEEGPKEIKVTWVDPSVTSPEK
jgi:hypothetical protein